MKLHVCVIPLLALTALSACFMSAEPRIETGTLLARGPVAFCAPDDPPCRTGNPSEDGYVIASGDDGEEDVRVRFEPLTEVGGVPVYLGEVELRDEGETGWIYVVVRPVIATVDGAPRFEIAMPDCNALAPGEGERPGLVRSDSKSCTVTDLSGFRQFLVETHAEEFADPVWWAGGD